MPKNGNENGRTAFDDEARDIIKSERFLDGFADIRIRIIIIIIPPLWSSGKSSRLQIQSSRVRFPALPDFVRVWNRVHSAS
jgi:hypothetical protein